MRRKISAGILLGITSLTLAGCTKPSSFASSCVSGCITRFGLMLILPIVLVICIPIVAKLIKAFSGVRHEAKMNKMQEKAMQEALSKASTPTPLQPRNNDKDDMQIF